MILLKMHAPLQILLGVSEDINTITLEVPAEGIKTLHDVFRYLAEQYPNFQHLTGQKADDLMLLRSTMIGVDEMILRNSRYEEVEMTDGSVISMYPRYSRWYNFINYQHTMY